MTEGILKKMILAVQDGESEGCADLARSALEEGIEPLKIVDEGLSAGIRIVGRKFGCGEMFLPDLMMAVEAMKAELKSRTMLICFQPLSEAGKRSLNEN